MIDRALNKTGVIYCFKSPSNKFYVGKTKNFAGRKKSHIRESQSNCNTKKCNAIQKYQNELKWFIIVDSVPLLFLNSFERYWINHLDSYDNGYNSTEGGDGGTTFIWTEERKNKQRIARLGKPSNAKGCKWSEEQKNKIRFFGEKNFFYGKHHSAAQKKKWSKMRKGVEPWNKGLTMDKSFGDAVRNSITYASCKFCCMVTNQSNLTRHLKHCPLMPRGSSIGAHSSISDRPKWIKCRCGDFFQKRSIKYHQLFCKASND